MQYKTDVWEGYFIQQNLGKFGWGTLNPTPFDTLEEVRAYRDETQFEGEIRIVYITGVLQVIE